MDRRQTGISIRGNGIQIDFRYRGNRCRELLKTKPTKTAVKEASRKREAILHAIAVGNFEYASFFPNSPKAIQYSNVPGQLILIKTALTDWLKKAQKRCELSTIKGYTSIIYYHLIPAFGDLYLTELNLNHINEWVYNQHISNKRINNILSPLRQVYNDAFFDCTIEKNPLERWRCLPIQQREPNPFNQYEIGNILSKISGRHRNLLLFAFYTGLRTSELIGLRWTDIDIPNDRFYVRVAIVEKHEKGTKTNAGLRTVELNTESLKALKNQLRLTNKQERVFLDPHTNKPWLNDQAIRRKVWIPALNKAHIDYRNPYQTRHTFASMMLSQGKNPLWVAQQMGHKDWGMIRKVYGRWIPQD